MRSRTAEVPTASHARAQTTPLRTSNHCRPRLHPEHPPRPLRTGNRASSKPTGPGCLRRAGHGDLTNLDLRLSAALTARNATAPFQVVGRVFLHRVIAHGAGEWARYGWAGQASVDSWTAPARPSPILPAPPCAPISFRLRGSSCARGSLPMVLANWAPCG